MIGAIIGNLIGILLLPLSFAFAYEAGSFLLNGTDYDVLSYVVYGFAAYLVVYVVFLLIGTVTDYISINSIHFLEVLEHETIHAIMTKLFFRQVESIAVSAGPGVTATAGPTLGCAMPFIWLGPYFIPLVTIPLVLAHPLVPTQWLLIVDFLIGFTLAFHVMSLVFNELHIGQTDFQASGLFLSICFILIGNAIFIVVAMAVATGDWPAIPNFFRDSIVTAQDYYRAVIGFIRSFLSPPTTVSS